MSQPESGCDFLLTNNMDKKNIRNIAVIAHVDHGKTTLVDGLLKQAKVFRENEEEFAMTTILDRNDLERERGITILSKVASVKRGEIKINIIDTPGHADFGGEVERVLNMADGALLIVDAQEGPMPQTKFVLKKAFELDLKVIVVINKIDKRDARVSEVEKEVENLFLELATDDKHLEYPILYAIGRDEKAWSTMPSNFNDSADLTVLFDKIVEHIPAPKGEIDQPFGMVITDLDFDNFNGKYVIGKISSGKVSKSMRLVLHSRDGKETSFGASKVMVYEGLGRVEVDEACVGDIVALTGVDGHIGEAVIEAGVKIELPEIKIEEPTLKVTLGVNTSPFSGREGKFSTSRQIGERLKKELETNLALRVEELSSGNEFLLSGRGELHLSILMENLRREGFEFQVGKPEVVLKEENGQKLEPVEEVVIDVSDEYSGAVNSEMSRRRGLLVDMVPDGKGNTRLKFKLTTRGTLGLRNALLSQTRGTAIVNSIFDSWQPLGAELPKLRSGVLIASEGGKAVTYGLNNAQQRGITFIEPQTEVYEGMIIGQNPREDDIEINVTKEKKLTNVRSSTSDISVILTPAKKMSLEECLNFLEADELLEITPENLRLRKRFLTQGERAKARNRA